MNAEQLFRKTMPFCMAKCALGGVMVLIMGLLLAIFAGIGWLFGDTGLFIGFLIWCGSIKYVHLLIMNYVGYLFKAGHIAVLAEVAATGQVPSNQVEYGKELVKERFVTANVYFALDKLVASAVKQIQRKIEKASNYLDFIPGMDKAASLVKWFVELSLGYIDECCLGYTFYQSQQGAFQSACDGVVIYAQNVKHLLKNAALTMLKLVLATLAAVLVIFIPVGVLFKILRWSGLFAFVLACLIAWVVKFAFLDSYVLCQTMAGYMAVAPTTQITFDLYGSLCRISSSFKEMWEKAKAEGGYSAEPSHAASAHEPSAYEAPSYEAPAYVTPAYQAPANNEAAEEMPVAYEAPQTPARRSRGKFCGNCGAKNESTAGFCGSCGTKL